MKFNENKNTYFGLSYYGYINKTNSIFHFMFKLFRERLSKVQKNISVISMRLILKHFLILTSKYLLFNNNFLINPLD